jgi:hypothetical protein
MEAPPHEMRLGQTEKDYYLLRNAGVAAPGNPDEKPAPGNEGEVTRPDPSLWEAAAHSDVEPGGEG